MIGVIRHLAFFLMLLSSVSMYFGGKVNWNNTGGELSDPIFQSGNSQQEAQTEEQQLAQEFVKNKQATYLSAGFPEHVTL